MNLLICNDDGIESEGILTLAKMLKEKNNIMVLAPENNRSASGHSITIANSIIFKEIKNLISNVKTYTISGTPADCVKFALHHLDFKPDAVISGINKGSNLGTDILYSGTVSAALEAVSFNIPAIAVSSSDYKNNNFDVCAEFINNNIETLIQSNDGSFVWNINVPNIKKDMIKGVKYTKMGYQVYSDNYSEIKKDEFILKGVPIKHDKNDSDCDVEWNLKGYITITPILFDKTDYNILNKVKEKLCQI